MLQLPSLEPAIDFLEASSNPTVGLRLARLRTPSADVAHFREKVIRQPVVQEAFSAQRNDGSWGAKERPGSRLLPTLWVVKTLTELGVDASSHQWRRAVEFLVEHGHADNNVFSISGRRDGVLSCYVGIAALLYLQGSCPDLAKPQLDWIIRFQEVKAGGRDRRVEPVAEWSTHLRTRYGGCMAETTCLVGLLRVGRALAMSGRSDAGLLVGAIREVFLERRLMYTTEGSLLPLAVSPSKADSWLAPTFPLDWRIDLIEVLDFVSRTGNHDERMQDAIAAISGFRLPDGTWPLRRTFRPEQLPSVERPNTRRSSPMITLRVIESLWPLRSSSST